MGTNNLIILTHNFPFGKGETFLETELSYLRKEFENIIIISGNVKELQTRNIDKTIKIFRYSTTTNPANYIKLPFLILKNSQTIFKIISNELALSIKKKKSNKVQIYGILIKSIIKALQFRDFISAVIKNLNLQGNIILYSYWFSYTANAISLMNSGNLIKISRAHSGDLYDEIARYNYQPMLNFKYQHLDSIFVISSTGINYIKTKLALAAGDKLKLSRLGVNKGKYYKPYNKPKETPFIIVSCSNLLPVKRVHLIIESLAKINSVRKIQWNHFGSGYLENELKELAKVLLSGSSNVIYNFHGHVLNEQLLKFYATNSVDLFINVSESEGIPVSIMEAMSYGIPAIATDAGGTREIVNNSNGILLHTDINAETLKEAIISFVENENCEKFRENAYMTWQLYYNANINYNNFINEIKSFIHENKS